ncbi:DUF4446 family protein [Nocardiopsis sp. NPDC050513]|uniref:DUF4446 family protein n=1 Tax=Nocardiopsis sp. NPDC050513 TaxID=3364338 RepID=UPI0037AA9BDE
MFTSILTSIGMFAGVGGLVLGGYALVRTREISGDARALADRAVSLSASGIDPRAVRDVAVLHYDALEEMSGARSFSLAMLNSDGDGVVLTSINGRTESRTYAKEVTRGEADSLLSPEEYRVIRSARLGNGVGASAVVPDDDAAGGAQEPEEAAADAPDTGERRADAHGEEAAGAGAEEFPVTVIRVDDARDERAERPGNEAVSDPAGVPGGGA